MDLLGNPSIRSLTNPAREDANTEAIGSRCAPPASPQARRTRAMILANALDPRKRVWMLCEICKFRSRPDCLPDSDAQEFAVDNLALLIFPVPVYQTCAQMVAPSA